MLSLIFIFLFPLLGSAIAIDGTKPPASGLSWTGEVEGHGVVTLYGNANSVEEQIFALNPSLAKNHVPTHQFMSKLPNYNASEVYAAENFTYYYKYPDSVAARDDVNGAARLSTFFGPMTWYCSTFATGDLGEAPEVVTRVGSPGGQDHNNAMWSIASGEGGKTNCQRLACAGTKDNPGSTAVYWCNDSGATVTTYAYNLAAVAASISVGHQAFGFAGCCLQSQKLGSHNQFSGQMHLGNATNINIGYGDCSQPDYFVHPDHYGYPGALGSCL